MVARILDRATRSRHGVVLIQSEHGLAILHGDDGCQFVARPCLRRNGDADVIIGHGLDNLKLLLHRAQRYIVALEGSSHLSCANIRIICVGIFIIRAFGKAERASDDCRLGGDGTACIGLVGNIGNGWSDFLHNDAAVAVLNDCEVVAGACSHVIFFVLIDDASAVLDARCVHNVNACGDGNRSDFVGTTAIGKSRADAVC